MLQIFCHIQPGTGQHGDISGTARSAFIIRRSHGITRQQSGYHHRRRQGIGYGITQAFAEQGASLCITGRNEQLAAWKEAYPYTFSATIQGIPLGRFGNPKTDIGRVTVFLASDLSSYVSGETITVQGGSGLRP